MHCAAPLKAGTRRILQTSTPVQAYFCNINRLAETAIHAGGPMHIAPPFTFDEATIMMKHELKISSMKEQCSEAEWEARVDLAVGARIERPPDPVC